ncbi:16S rRNA (guanine(966)-N(2))-methyltransferase RsmD [Paracoccaceae bacterium]|nr:16S rRNA (guanine(966)-N(2))-methyltransferase RsmD [Paracoccaceae bacterium]
MRILSGKLKGSKILTNNNKIKGSDNFITRPTSDRVKETLFNIVQHGFYIDFTKISFLDCFSGSGSIGLEAISRGCLSVSFLEKNNAACECIKKNLANFKLTDNDKGRHYHILNYDFFDKDLLLDKEFDVVFLDPPYEMADDSEVFVRLKELQVTKKNSLIIYESNKELVKVDRLEILKRRKIGKTQLSFLKVLNS